MEVDMLSHSFSIRTTLALATLASACAPTNVPTGESRGKIIGGSIDTGDPAVVVFNDSCTAELISPHVLLTAAHCVNPPPSGPVSIFTGVDKNDPAGVTVPVKEFHANPLWDPNVDASPHDIAVLILADPLNLTPIAINRAPLDQSLVGQPVRIVGYGQSSTPSGPNDGFGVRRQATAPLLSFDTSFVRVGNPTANQCFGDSGGPALMTINNVEVIVGVDSFGEAGETCLQSNGDTRVDEELDFIDPFVAANDPPKGTCTPQCSGKQCGTDGCGGNCGACPNGQSCDANGQCQSPVSNSCGHDLCAKGSPLDPTCDRCVGQICAQDSFCCDTRWDKTCVNEVGSICGLACY
jgi:V8-like Glu-specific endopeptidase